MITHKHTHIQTRTSTSALTTHSSCSSGLCVYVRVRVCVRQLLRSVCAFVCAIARARSLPFVLLATDRPVGFIAFVRAVFLLPLLRRQQQQQRQCGGSGRKKQSLCVQRCREIVNNNFADDSFVKLLQHFSSVHRQCGALFVCCCTSSTAA